MNIKDNSKNVSSIVLGFSGRIKSGKSSVSYELARALAWPRVAFGDHLRLLAIKQNLPETRETLQELGAQMVEKDCRGFCMELLKSINWKPGQHLIIDGIRHMSVLMTLRQMVYPAVLKLVYLDADDEILEKRHQASPCGSLRSFVQIEKHSTEKDVVIALREAAELRVDSTKSIVETVGLIIAWLQNLNAEFLPEIRKPL